MGLDVSVVAQATCCCCHSSHLCKTLEQKANASTRDKSQNWQKDPQVKKFSQRNLQLHCHGSGIAGIVHSVPVLIDVVTAKGPPKILNKSSIKLLFLCRLIPLHSHLLSMEHGAQFHKVPLMTAEEGHQF